MRWLLPSQGKFPEEREAVSSLSIIACLEDVERMDLSALKFHNFPKSLPEGE